MKETDQFGEFLLAVIVIGGFTTVMSGLFEGLPIIGALIVLYIMCQPKPAKISAEEMAELAKPSMTEEEWQEWRKHN
jgi:hypothetical protein